MSVPRSSMAWRNEMCAFERIRGFNDFSHRNLCVAKVGE